MLGDDDLNLRMKHGIKGEHGYVDDKTFTSFAALESISDIHILIGNRTISYIWILWTAWTTRHMFTQKEQGSYMGKAIILQLSIIKSDQDST